MDHAPGVLHAILAREATVVTVQRVVQEPLIGFLPLTERMVEVDVEIDRLGRELLPGAFRLDRQRDPVLVSEPKPEQVRVGTRALLSVKSMRGGSRSSTTASNAVAVSALPART